MRHPARVPCLSAPLNSTLGVMQDEAPRVHDPSVIELLREVEADRGMLFRLAGDVILRPGKSMFPMDILAIGAIKRNVSTAAGFRTMVQTWNVACAKALLRMHLDTALRFSAAWLVEDSHAFASAVLAHERIDKIRDKNNDRLTDAHIVASRESELPWLPRIYKHLSGFVHFSGQHIYTAVLRADAQQGSIEFEITDFDYSYPTESWVELVSCFREGTEFLANYLRSYGTSRLSEATNEK